MNKQKIILKNVKVHNLKGVDLTLPSNELIIFTGVSGSGKSSLAFDTLYVEGQRRYVESLSTFARRQMNEMVKPDMEYAEGISPTISIEQKTAGKNPRSTVGTMTEIYDYLRVLYARVGIPHCPISKEKVTPQSREKIIKTVQNKPDDTKIIVLSPYAKGKKAEFKEDFLELQRKGYTRVRLDGKILSLADDIELDGSVAHDVDIVIDRLTINVENHSRIAEALTNALTLGEGVCSVLDATTNEETLYSMHAYSQKSGLSYSSLEPHDFSFNSPSGMCPRCFGLGHVQEFDIALVIDEEKSIAEDCCTVGSSYTTVRYGNIYNNLARLYGFDVNTPWKNLSKEAQHVFLYGTEKKWTRMHFIHPITGQEWVDNIQWRGVLWDAHSRFAEAKSDTYRKKALKLMTDQICPECHGSRLKPYPSAALIGGKPIHMVCKMTIGEIVTFFEKLKLNDSDTLIAGELLKEIISRLRFLNEVGLHYLTLDRTAPTLSGGEAQRVRLASQIGCGLVGITYVLDEPSIGLHPRDNLKLIGTLKHLRDIGNSVIVVEHDEETILEADRIIDFGPGPGTRGGTIVANGDLKDLLNSTTSLTADYLSGRKSIAIPKKRRKGKNGSIEIKGAAHNNLKNIDISLPLGVFIAVTGVSGSGKSSLITDILHPYLSNTLHNGDLTVGKVKTITGIDAIDKVIAIDQSPIGRNPRSNPGTYIKLFDDIRELFAELPESRAKGYKAGRFSFNVKEGSCPQCNGMGMVKIDMDFMEDAWVECSLCGSSRFDPETLSIEYKGKNINDILEMEVTEALELFHNIPHIKHKLQMLKDVGMEYIKIGQSSTTLSGGEAQRIKLAKELVRPATGKTLYILDEPTTGLHFHDIKHLLEVLNALVNKGNTVLVIEHNMDVVKTADWIIDLGPEGGAFGGQIVATGTPEKIAKMDTPTGIALLKMLNHDFEQRIKEILDKDTQTKQQKIARSVQPIKEIIVTDAEQNNLKQINAAIPRQKITVCTGPSGSGKSSLAFETIYAEGQRRYIESLSPYARQFVKQMPKPKVGNVEGLSPAVAIEQKAHAGNPRSTVGTMTEIYDYLRLLWAHLGIAYCPETGEVIKSITKEYVIDRILEYPEGEKVQILAPIEIRKNDSFTDVINRLKRQGYLRIRLNGTFYDLDADENNIDYDRKRKNELLLVIDRLKINNTMRSRLAEAVDNSARLGNNRIIAMRDNGDQLFNLAFAVESTGKSYPTITPHTFAFNNAEGMCIDCLGLGYQYGANLLQIPGISDLSTMGLMSHLWGEKNTSEAEKTLFIVLDAEKIDPYVPLKYLSQAKLHIIFNGSPAEKWYKDSRGFLIRWKGINNVLAKAGRNAVNEIKESIIPFLDELQCPSCFGTRLNQLARHVKVEGLSIAAYCRLPLDKALEATKKIVLSKDNRKLLEEVKKQITSRLQFLCEVGLEYIALDRKAPTLSGGEAQRIRLARQLGSGLTGVLYVLDEPTIGLHPRDNDRLNNALQQLKDLGNTLLLVEHDPQTIATADYIMDFGPQAGAHGGHITAKGTYKQILKNKNSLTGQYLSGKKTIDKPKKRRLPKGNFLTIENAKAHNLKNIDVKIPCSVMTCFTGVSGSGKSSLLQQIIQPAIQKGLWEEDVIQLELAKVSGILHFDKMICIDQNPIGHTSRSDVGTYSDVLTPMREFFAAMPLSRTKGFAGRNFSYNQRKGMCTNCWGLGYRKVEMHFLPPVRVTCEECQGLRLNKMSLEVEYKGKNFGEWLLTSVDEMRIAFADHPKIRRILDTLMQVGLGYLQIGQEIASLSGGEAQRIKLSRELAKRSTGKTLYLLDEPTTGLHPDDIGKLLSVLHKLVDKGNTMIIIEHNLEVIKNCDYIIDLGPEAGEKGGYLVCQGTPEQVAANKKSYTGKYLDKFTN